MEIRKLKKYTPTKFMLKTSHYDKEKADHAVNFIQNLTHTKGEWDKQKFELIDWQEQIIRDIFGIVKEDGTRQFRTAYVEIPKKQGKSELAAAIALLLTGADKEASAEVYGCASDKEQATIVYDVAAKMIDNDKILKNRFEIRESKRLITYPKTNSRYKVLSSEAFTKHGLNVSGVVFDELHAQPNRELFDVMTKGSGDARKQPLYFLITTAGNSTDCIGYEVHCKAKDIIDGRKYDPSFYPVIYGADKEEDWTSEEVWKKANPSLGITVDIERVREACESAKQNPSEEMTFRQLRLNQWTGQVSRWLPVDYYDKCYSEYTEEDLKGRRCYGGLDLSSTGDITAFSLVFPPNEEDGEYYSLDYYWIPEETVPLRSKNDSVLYDQWVREKYLMTTEGNVIHYGFIERYIEELSKKFEIVEIAFDRWGATQVSQNLEGMGLVVMPFGQGYKDMSPPTKEFEKLIKSKKLRHNGNPVSRWMFDNLVIRKDPAGNIKLDKEKAAEKIDGMVARVMALDRAVRRMNSGSIYEKRGLIVL